MKKIINGAKYDTNTAKCIGQWDNDLPSDDFEYCSEDLYRTKSGKYFLHGEGGGNSRYGEWHGNTGGPGEQIMPMTREDAKLWAESNLDVEDYEAIFGKVSEDGEKEPLYILINPALKSKLWALAENKGTSINVLVEEALEQLVK